MMHTRVACVTQRDQVFFRIVARVTSEILVVHLEVGHRTARLAFACAAACTRCARAAEMGFRSGYFMSLSRLWNLKLLSP